MYFQCAYQSIHYQSIYAVWLGHCRMSWKVAWQSKGDAWGDLNGFLLRETESEGRCWQMVPRVIQASYTTYTGSYHHTQDWTAKHIIYTAVQWMEAGRLCLTTNIFLFETELCPAGQWLSVVIIVLEMWCKQIWKLASLAAACPGATQPILLIIIVSHV